MSDTIGGRLSEALERYAPRGIRGDKKAFTRCLGDVKGSSYPTVLGYFADNVEPSPTWLRAAADVVGVRPEWLAFGTGEPVEMLTESEARAKQVKNAAQITEAIDSGWHSRAGIPFPSGGLAVLMANDLWRRAWAPRMEKAKPEPMAVHVGRALALPLAALGVSQVNQKQLEDYVVGMSQVLTRILEAEEGNGTRS